jgi:hypothetical protein
MNYLKQMQLDKEYGWKTSSHFEEGVEDVLISAGKAIQKWLQSSGTTPEITNLAKFGNVFWEPCNFLWRKAGFHHVELQTVYIYPERITLETAVHEMAHILDNKFGSTTMSSILGGGPSDNMFRFIGGEPDLFFPRFLAFRFEEYMQKNKLEINPTPYGATRGPAEDFAETFQLAILNPGLLEKAAPQRFAWFINWRDQICNR